MEGKSDLSAPRSVRLGALLAVAALHLLAAMALIRAFAPQLVTQVLDQTVATFSVRGAPPPPQPPASAPAPAAGQQAAGTAGLAGRHAIPREAMAPRPRLVIRPARPAPPVAANGAADSAGARDAGDGTGAGTAGSGTGSGGAGDGQGNGGGSRAVKIAGDINSARDYPVASRDLRIGERVIIALTVGTDGRVTACRVVRPSRDAEADAITCRLATARFRFRPATDASGQAVTATFGWQQRWFYKE